MSITPTFRDFDEGFALPRLCVTEDPAFDAVAFIRDHRDLVDQEIHAAGGVLFRGVGGTDALGAAVRASETLVLRNEGTATLYLPAEQRRAGAPLLRWELPDGARDLRMPLGIAPEGLLEDGTTLSMSRGRKERLRELLDRS